MGLHVVVGAGAVGGGTATLLAEQGHRVRVVTRSGRGPRHPDIELVKADAADAAALRRAAAGADALYNAVSPGPYQRWVTDWPPIATSLLAAAEATSAVLVSMSNLYGYGPVEGAMTEDLPLAASSRKGRLRARMSRDALAAHEAGRIRAAEARSADYIGPGMSPQDNIGRVLASALAGKPAWAAGDPDAPHTWTYLPDVARVLVVLGTDERAWGRAWHVPSGPPLSQRAVAEQAARLAGAPAPTVRAIPSWVFRAAGLASPLLREIPEVLYQFERPFVMDSSAFTSTFGVTATPTEEALRATVESWRERERAAA